MIRSSTVLTALALLAATTIPAAALTPQEEAAFQRDCGGDYMRFCAMHDPNSPQVEQCFKTNMKQLSSECQRTITAFNRRNPSGRR